jgi:hypothetical protein
MSGFRKIFSRFSARIEIITTLEAGIAPDSEREQVSKIPKTEAKKGLTISNFA